jgi:hypothetical protein
MKSSQSVTLILVVIASLVVGGVIGFILGVASTKAGKAFLEELLEEEQNADVAHPHVVIRDRFQLQYPTNWKIDVNEEDYDPDQNFSIDSPGSAFVMFAIGTEELEAEESLRIYLRQYEKLGSVAIERFERFGRYTGKGAIVKDKSMGVRSTIKLFAFNQKGSSFMITQHWPDEDLKKVQAGLNLIENSFSLVTKD